MPDTYRVRDFVLAWRARHRVTGSVLADPPRTPEVAPFLHEIAAELYPGGLETLRAPRACAYCGGVLPDARSDRRYCKQTCWQAAKIVAQRERRKRRGPQ